MSDDLESLRAEVAALRAELAETRTEQQHAITRRRLLTGLAGLGAAGAAGVATAGPAAADDGDSLALGEENSASRSTQLYVSLDQAVQPDHALRIVMEDPAEPLSLDFPQHPALLVESAFTGVTGYGSFNGVYGVTEHGVGVVGEALTDGGSAVWGLSIRGPAATFQSEDGVTLGLTPSSTAGPPASQYTYAVGSLSVDDDGEVWLCVTGGTPGTWTRLLREDTAPGRTIPITPIRVLDTRSAGGRPSGAPAVPGQKAGPLKGGQPLTLDLAGVGAIPTDASGVVGSIAAVKPSYNGFLRAAPSGTTVITSAVNFTKGATVANAFTSALGAAGLTVTGSGGTGNTYHCVVDITAYIT